MPRFRSPLWLPGDPTDSLQAATKAYVDAQGGGNEKTANKSISTAKVPNGYIGADASGNISRNFIYLATSSDVGIVRLTNDLGGTASAPTVPGLATKAPLVPGATTIPLSGSTGTPDGSNGAAHHRLSISSNLTLALATGVVDTQRLLYEITATAAGVTITLANDYEIGGTARTRSFPVRNGATAYIYVIVRGTTQRLASIDDGG